MFTYAFPVEYLDVQVVLDFEVAAGLHPGRESLGDFLRARDLGAVDGQARHVGARGPHHAPQRPADPATHVEHLQKKKKKKLRGGREKKKGTRETDEGERAAAESTVEKARQKKQQQGLS
jgi:hypothetical protein